MENGAASKDSLIKNEAVRLREISSCCFGVVIDNPPFNLIDSQVFAGLKAVKSFAEDSANDVRVLVFESANPEFFGAHLDLMGGDSGGSGHEVNEPMEIIQEWPAFSYWLGTTPVVSIAILRGRARGFAFAFAAAADMRFASKENTRLCLPEVGFGAFPGGGGIEWAQLHAGRARAMEFLLSSDDLDGDTAELYGLVNRSIDDAELDEFVYKLGRRIASFTPASIAAVKSGLTKLQPIPLPEEMAGTLAVAGALQSSDAAQAVAMRIMTKAGGLPFSRAVELDLPRLCDVD
ncbi:enoyl-CoA hydratase-related protein [Streptomyces sp. NPDC093544]|jgi:enoyl-CoA hydratase/carnithine racemase|uniref:enoyl-CoA hydratase/isomerase family protein n=1 Tax=Streptomyces sp. NPDC093544 TaxID=3155200 RepID=UPI0034265C80